MSFPDKFIWGTASASYQVEGAAFEDGKGPSVWDLFSHLPGKTYCGHTGDVAADAYHRFEEDLDIMQKLGIKNYRFSISWPRVFPTGEAVSVPGSLGAGVSSECGESSTAPSANTPSGLNPEGIAYYDRLVDGCLSRGITPWITLYHWDLPLALFRKGGWMNRDTALHFSDYASYIARHFKGRVKNYITINEPQCAIGLAHVSDVHAPGIKYDYENQFLSWHNIMLAHGYAVRAIRAQLPDASIGFASTGVLPYIKEHADVTPPEVADSAFHSPSVKDDSGFYFNHQWFLDPVFFGRYPDDPENPWIPFAEKVSDEDLKIISSPVDFIGLNIYNGYELAKNGSGYETVERYPGFPRTALKWPVTPEVLYWGPRLVYERYKKDIYILENGTSCNDRIYLDGEIHDPDRIDFLHRYLSELKKCCEDGVPVKGYFHWSFTDNYEWHSGYDDRFGLIYIDYRDQKRIVKDSARWYAGVLETNGQDL